MALSLATVAVACGSTEPTPPPKTSSPTPTAAVVSTGMPTSTTELTPAPTGTATASLPTPPTSPTAAQGVALDAKTAAALQATLQSLRDRGNFPGISAAVVFPDGAMWTGQAGVGVLSTKAELTPDTLFSVGSITKTFTGALALRLAERGTISLDDRLSKWVPTYPNAANITLRELLNHTSGIRDFFETATFKYIDADHNATWTPEQVLARIGKPYFAPGKGYHYSSTNYVLLGLVLERATGKQLAELVRTEFLDPLGLSHTFLQSEEPITGTLAHGYLGPPTSPKDVSVGQAMLPYVSVATASGASGALVSTPSDIAKWATALYGGELLDHASMAAMLDVSTSAPYHPEIQYGLAVERLPVGGRLGWGHRGHLDGFWSTMVYLPASHLTFVVLVSADWPDPLKTVGAMVTAVLGPA